MHAYIQVEDKFYVGGDRCTWSIQPQGLNKPKFSFLVDTSGMGPNSSVFIYNSDFENFEDSGTTKAYAGYSKATYNDLELEGSPMHVTFIASSDAPPASGPRIWLRQVSTKQGMPARLAISIGLSLLFGIQVVLGVVAWRRYQRKVLEARRAEELAARCWCPCSPREGTDKLSIDKLSTCFGSSAQHGHKRVQPHACCEALARVLVQLPKQPQSWLAWEKSVLPISCADRRHCHTEATQQ